MGEQTHVRIVKGELVSEMPPSTVSKAYSPHTIAWRKGCCWGRRLWTGWHRFWCSTILPLDHHNLVQTKTTFRFSKLRCSSEQSLNLRRKKCTNKRIIHKLLLVLLVLVFHSFYCGTVPGCGFETRFSSLPLKELVLWATSLPLVYQVYFCCVHE